MHKGKKVYFQNLDALRFWAFLAVFSFHKFYQEFDYTTNSDIANTLSFIFSKGNVSVNFFFILSSFLITYFLLLGRKESGTISLKTFYIKRILRTWPLYFINVILGFYLFPVVFSHLEMFQVAENANEMRYLLFFSNIDIIQNGIPRFGGLGVFWTLSVEEQYYLLWPLLLLLFYKRSLWLFGLITIGAFVFRSFHYQNADVLYFHTFSVMSDLAIGGLLAWLCLHNEKLISKITLMPRIQIILLYIVGFSLTILWYGFFKQTYLVIFERLTVGFFFSFIIMEQVFAKHSFYKAGKWSFANYWGKKSYALYCFHCFGILFAHLIMKQLGAAATDFNILLVETLLAIAISFLFGWLSEVLIEAPLRNVKVKYVSKSNA